MPLNASKGYQPQTRSDMAESMLGLNRLPSQIESRKLMFLHKILSLASNSVTRNIFIRKLILFINNNSLVSTGFIPDICNILCKYNFLSIVNNILVPGPHIPSKNEWKRTVKIAITERESLDWDHRMSLDLNFTFFRILLILIQNHQNAILIIIATFPVDVAIYTGSENFCDISRQQCDIYRQWGLRRFQQIATFPGDGATFSVDDDISRRCDIFRRYTGLRLCND